MKRTSTLLVICFFVAYSLIGQQIADKPDHKSRLIREHPEFMSRKNLMRDSMPMQLENQRMVYKTSRTQKSLSVIRQKMDSCHVQKLDRTLNVLKTINKDSYAFDSGGRLILAISYTSNTWNGEFIWNKDTASYYANGKTTLEARYTRLTETDPWSMEYKTESFYNAIGNDTLVLYSEPDWDSGESVTSKMVKVYNADNLRISLTVYSLDHSTGVWKESWKAEATYNSEGNEIADSYFDWSEDTRSWVHTGQHESTYDADGRITSSSNYYLDGSIQAWVGSWSDESAYDAGGNLILYIYYDWSYSDSKWVPQEKISRTFDPNGLMTEYISYLWSVDDNQWVAKYRESRVYDPKGNLIEFVQHNWNKEVNQWIPESRELDTYDSNNNNIQASYLSWNETTGAWVENSRQEMEFDNSGNLVHSLLLSDKDSTGQWKSKTQFNYVYDNAFTKDEIITPYGWSGVEPAHMLLSGVGERWDRTTEKWITSFLQDYYYSEFNSSSISEIRLSNILVYPNPVVDIIYIVTEQPSESLRFELIDMQGRKVLSENLTGVRNQISVGELPGGIYLYQIIRNGEISYGKIMKR